MRLERVVLVLTWISSSGAAAQQRLFWTADLCPYTYKNGICRIGPFGFRANDMKRQR